MGSAAEANSYHRRPESESDIVKLAQRTLLRADCVGVLPTPLDRLYSQSRIESIELPSIDGVPLLRLTREAKSLLRTAMQKVRGIADLRRRAVYIPTGGTDVRRSFAKAHELGHQLIPWHRLGRDCIDTDRELTADTKVTFEIEANLFASEVLFQGKEFGEIARNYTPTLEAVLTLADLHGASKQATLWKFAEEHDMPVVSLPYYPNRRGPGFNLWKPVASPAFLAKYADIPLPDNIVEDHPWALVSTSQGVSGGEIELRDRAGKRRCFLWSGWWNTHSILILLRARSLIGRILR